MKIINTFKSKDDQIEYYDLKYAKLVYENGDYRIFKRFHKSFVHTFKNYAIAELTGQSMRLIETLITKNYESYLNKFMLARVIENKEKGSNIAYRIRIRAGKRKKKEQY